MTHLIFSEKAAEKIPDACEQPFFRLFLLLGEYDIVNCCARGWRLDVLLRSLLRGGLGGGGRLENCAYAFLAHGCGIVPYGG